MALATGSSLQHARLKRRLAAIMIAEVVGFSRLVEANEEGALAAILRHRQELLDLTIARHNGRIFKSTGDCLLIEFASAIDAVQCAVEIQRGMAERNSGIPEDRHIRFRIGINLGDVIIEGDDIFGDDVNVAARLVGHAQPGGIACSAGIRHQVGSKLDVEFLDQGERRLKNIALPVHVFSVQHGATRMPGKQRDHSAGLARSRPDKPSIAVLPFANMSGDPEQGFFSDGITEDIITDLTNVSELFVLSRNSVFRHRDSPADMEQIARDLGVTYLVHGSVRKSGSRVRITAQLTEGASGGQVWADRYDRDMTDIFALQDEITETIVGQLKVKLFPEERKAIGRAPTKSVEAYTFYLKGREYFHRGSKTNYLLAKLMFAKAIELDPGYARAYAGLADCDAFLYMDYSEDVVAGVLRNSEKALALEPGLVEARASRGLALAVAHRYAEAEQEFESTIAEDPGHFEASFFYGRCCYAQGKLEQTAEHWERAAEVKPDDYQALILLNQVYASLGRPDLALRAGQLGVQRAEREFEKNPENPRPAYFIATTLAKLGEIPRARDWASRALAIAPDDYLTQYNIACFHSVCGDLDRAFEMLEVLLPSSNAEMRDWILSDSDLEALHGDPRWPTIRRMALVQEAE